MTEDNEQALLQAANARKVRQALSKLTPAGLRSLSKTVAADRRAVLWTTWSWTDEAGVYYGDDGAWLYRTVPVTALAAGSLTLQRILDALAQKLGERPVHLLTHQWEEAAEVPDGLAEGHKRYLKESLRLLVPGQVFLIGVKLDEDPESLKSRAAPRAAFSETVERILGEWVPDLSAYHRDAETVHALLEQFGALVPSAGAQDMLESWYSLGVSRDLDAEETDDAILIRGAQTIEMVSVRSFSEQRPTNPSAPPSPGAGGTLVVSARGTLRLARTTSHATGHAGVLDEASIVMGRHSAVLTGTLADACSSMDGVGFKPLPMRQAPALTETLPCASGLVDPNLFRVDAATLALAGFNEPIPAGDRSGLLVGMVEPNYSYPLYLDLFAQPGYVLAVAGAAGTGTALVAEHLAAQAKLARRKVLFLNGRTDHGAGLVGTPEAPVTLTDAPRGLLDPFHHLGPDLGPHAFMHVVRQALPQLGEETLDAITKQLSRAAVAKITSATRAVRLLADPAHAAQLVKFSRTPVGRLLFLPDDTQLPDHPVSVWDAPTLLGGIEDPTMAAILGDLLLATALVRARGGLLVTDHGSWARGTVTHAVAQNLGAAAGATLIVTDDARRLTSEELPPAAATLLLACESDEPAAFLAAQGVKNVEAVCAWLTTTRPEVDMGVIVSPDRGFVFDSRGNKAAFLVGPVPRDRVRAYTRGAAVTYEMDAKTVRR